MLKACQCAIPPWRSNLRVTTLRIRNLLLISSLKLLCLWFMPIASILSHLEIENRLCLFFHLFSFPINSLIHQVVSPPFSLRTTWLLFLPSQSNSGLDALCQGHQALLVLASHVTKHCSFLPVCANLVFSRQQAVQKLTLLCAGRKMQSASRGPKRDQARFSFLLTGCLPMGKFLPRLKFEACAHENVILSEKEETAIWCSGFVLFFTSFWLARNDYTL